MREHASWWNKASNSRATPASDYANVKVCSSPTYACLWCLQVRLSWLVQALQLCQLCCLVLAANTCTPDTVLDAAAARLLQLMTSSTAWCAPEHANSHSNGTSTGVSCQQAAAAGLLDGIRSQPMPLLLAARRCVQQHKRLLQQRQQHSSPPPRSLDEASMTASGACLQLTRVVHTRCGSVQTARSFCSCCAILHH